jgi:hypothetical protein
MIAFERQPEPPDFDERVRQPGRKWLAEHPAGDPPSRYWRRARLALKQAFDELCAYSVTWCPNGTVDHYISRAADRAIAYEWSNFRYAEGWVNSTKQDLDGAVLDPFEVHDDWFEPDLTTFVLSATDRVPDDARERAEYTLDRLHLRDGEEVVPTRMEWHRMYVAGEITLDALRKKAPLIARAIVKQQARV